MSMDTFVREGNVGIYLSKLYQTADAQERDVLLRLLVAEEDLMGRTREHLENGQRRVAEGKRRLHAQRELIAQLPPAERSTGPAALMLESMEKLQALLESHVQTLSQSFERRKL